MDFKDILDRGKKIKNADGNDLILEKSKGTITTTAIGAGVGMVIAHYRNANLLFGAVIGATLAGLVYTYFINKDG